MPKALWNEAVLAESDSCEVVEGNYYFPPESINQQYFEESKTHTTCSWKDVASYYNIVVGGRSTRTRPGTIPLPKKLQRIFKTTSPSGGE